MFCKKCGAQIDNDSEFCKSCGAKQNNESQERISTQKYCSYCGTPITNEIICPKCDNVVEAVNYKVEPPIKRKIRKTITTVFTIIMITAILSTVAIICKSLIGNNPGSSETESNQPEIFKRNANINDLEISDTLNVKEISYVMYITPKTDIDDLQIKIKFYDKSDNLLNTITKTLGDVEKGKEYKCTITITDFPNILKLDYSTIEVSKGTVSKLQ